MARKLLTVLALASLALAGSMQAHEFATSSVDEIFPGTHGAVDAAAVPLGMTKADVDTIYLMGGPERQDGKFETASGLPDWQGWTTTDFTFDGIWAWNIDDERVLEGSRSMVCGAVVDGVDGPIFGYDNNWNKYLAFTYNVPDPGQSVTLRLTGTMRVSTELDYDFVYLQANTAAGWENFSAQTVWHGRAAMYPLDHTVTLSPEDFVGPGSSQAQIRFYFFSDVGWADSDGLIDHSNGPCWLDDLSVYMDGDLVDHEDFEDGVSDNWEEVLSPGVGDYAALYQGLLDLDTCRSNNSVQVAFVDDGVVVPGTGGTTCITWCYGPGGYIVTNSGGLLGPTAHIQNGIISEPLIWPAGSDAAQLVFGVYMHEPMTTSSGGVMYEWYVRSTASSDPADLENQEWTNDLTVWYGPPIYINHGIDLTSYLEPGRQHLQIMLRCWEAGWLFDVEGSDGTPHPYFDNVRVLAYPFGGPAMLYDPLFIAQDNFPEQGDLDYGNLGSNHIRFDMARNISPAADQRNDPGDSLFVDVVPVRAGSILPQLPQMVVRMKANPVFDGVRALPAGFSQSGNIITGTVEGDSTYSSLTGNLVEDRYNFDLPDTGFFYPGDVIHYYFEAWDELGGDTGHTVLPGDTSGFASFAHDLAYPSDFICRGLPSLKTSTVGDHPEILFWNDFANRGGENEWYHALNHAGLVEGVGYDLYYTNAPDAGEGNGLGGRTTSAVLDGYDILLYTSGNLLVYTLGNGDFASDPSADIQLINAWFSRGNKKAFMTGDDLVYDVAGNGAEGQALVGNYFGVELVDRNLVSFIDNQTAPTVYAEDPSPIFPSVDRWIAYGGCLGINTFDVIEPRGGGQRLAEFAHPSGNTGVYDYAAAVYNYNDMTDTEVILLPYDFMYVYNAPGYTPPVGLDGVSARGVMLRDVLNYFGLQLDGPIAVDDMPDVRQLAVQSYPNPFNPKATIALSMPRTGQVSVKIFNVRGELINTLVDGTLEAGRHELVWDGSDHTGARSSSGVYFAETRALGQTRVNRMAMVK